MLANSADPDELQHYAAFHLGLHCLSKYLIRGLIQRIKLHISGSALFSSLQATRNIWTSIGVQWGQENPNSRVHQGSPYFPLERWTHGLGFSGSH